MNVVKDMKQYELVFWTGNSINSFENDLALFCSVKNVYIL